MEPKNEILEELKGISPLLASIERINVFSVPEHYFSGLEDRLAQQAMAAQSAKIISFEAPAGDKKFQSAGAVPEGYFENLSNHILAKIKASAENAPNEEEEILSPLLSSLNKSNPLTVPAGYFENLSDQVLAKVRISQPAKVVSMRSGWWKAAAAAVIATTIGISTYFFNDTTNGNHPGTEQTYASIANQYKTTEQIDKGIASLTDDEIINYLEDHGNVLDENVLINGTDQSSMPNLEDYLIDENTLNNYLKKIDADGTLKIN